MADKLTPSQGAPEAGAWKTVPVEPTWQMKIAGRDSLCDTLDDDAATDDAGDAYRAMLAASPSPPPVVGEQGSLLKEAEEALRKARAEIVKRYIGRNRDPDDIALLKQEADALPAVVAIDAALARLGAAP